jgi:Acetyltransferase (isoleucine patch superfamily)
MPIETIKRLLQSKIRQKRLDNLKKNGLRVGNNFNMQGGCTIDHSHCWLISIGDSVTLAPKVQILAHDASTKMFLGYTKIGKVSIGSYVFIGAGSIVLPNVKIGSNVIIGAGSVVTRDIPSDCVAFGNPCKVYCTLSEYLSKNKRLMKINPVYNSSYTLRNGDLTSEMRNKMRTELTDKIGYVE